MSPLLRTFAMLALVAAVTLAAIGGATALEKLLSDPAPDPFPDPPFAPYNMGDMRQKAKRAVFPELIGNFYFPEQEEPLGFRDWQYHFGDAENANLDAEQAKDSKSFDKLTNGLGDYSNDRRKPNESMADLFARQNEGRFLFSVLAYNKNLYEIASTSLRYGAMSKCTPDEREAVKAAFFGSHYVKGRELAEKALGANPQSIPALMVLANVQYHAEANLPTALYTIRRARHLLEELGKADPKDKDNRELYLRCLVCEMDILNDLDRPDQALRVVQMIEQVYAPMPHWELWPLLKLHRFEEAEKALTALEPAKWEDEPPPKPSGNSRADRRSDRDDPKYRPPMPDHWSSTRLNGRALLAMIHHSRKGFSDAIDQQRLLKYNPLGTYLSACAVDSDLKYPAPGYAYGASLTAVGTLASWSPYVDIAACELQTGNFRSAGDALMKAIEHRAQRMPDTWQQDQAEYDRGVAMFLLALGHASDAERFSRQAVENPSRSGRKLIPAASRQLVALLTHWTVLQARLAQQEETDFLTTAGLSEREAERAKVRAECWTLESQILQLVADPDRPNPLRPYLPGEARLEAWLQGEFLHVLPAGVAGELLRQGREADNDPDRPMAGGYYDAFEAEAAYLRGDYEAALKLASAALMHPPVQSVAKSVENPSKSALSITGERLLRARTSAIAAEAARQLGNRDQYLHRMDMALDNFPAVLRLLNIAIPVQFKDDGDPLAERVVAGLRRSPRFRDEPDGFVVTVKRAGEYLVLEMNRLTDAATISRRDDECEGEGREEARKRIADPIRLRCKLPVGADETATVADAIRDFTAQLMSAGIPISTADVNLFDTPPSDAAARQGLDRLFQ